MAPQGKSRRSELWWGRMGEYPRGRTSRAHGSAIQEKSWTALPRGTGGVPSWVVLHSAPWHHTLPAGLSENTPSNPTRAQALGGPPKGMEDPECLGAPRPESLQAECSSTGRGRNYHSSRGTTTCGLPFSDGKFFPLGLTLPALGKPL